MRFASYLKLLMLLSNAIYTITLCNTKKNSKTKVVDFGKFWCAEDEYDIYFFLSRQVFSAFYILIQKDRPEFSLLDL